VSRALHVWCASATVCRLTPPLQPRNRARLFLGPVDASPSLTPRHIRQYEPATRTGSTTNTVELDTWIWGLWGSSDTSNSRGQLWYVSSSSYCPFHPLIHSGRMTWMVSFAFLVQATQVFLGILLTLSRPCLIGWRVKANPRCCEDRSRTHDACHASRPHAPTSDLAAFPLPPRATVYRHRILQSIEHPYQRNQSLMYASSRRWPGANSVLDHPHLRHNPRASSSLIDVHSRPSHCVPRGMLQIPVLPQRGLFL